MDFWTKTFGSVSRHLMECEKLIPDTLEEVPYETEIRFFATERGLYFGILNHQPADTLVSRYTNRDTSLFASIVDAIRVY